MSELVEQMILVAAGAAWARASGLRAVMLAASISTLARSDLDKEAMVAGVRMENVDDYRRDRVAYS